MLSADDQALLTQTGRGSPMGELLRRYWVPVMLSSELPSTDCSPQRVKVLGERLVAFRDSSGAVSLIDEFCPHRRASLFFGRNEECGIRCVYHGWKFDRDGQCVDMPNEPSGSSFSSKVTIRAYPCHEIAGVVWTYMGPPELKPELPAFEFLQVPQSHRRFSQRVQECNYFQALEGGIDSSHISFLHREVRENRTQVETISHQYTAPKFEVEKTSYGLLIGARRETDNPAEAYWRVTHYVLPWYGIIPPVFNPNARITHAWVPIDDENCMHWSFTWDPVLPFAHEELVKAHHVDLIPGTLRPVQNKDNDYLIDRHLQASGRSYTGIANVSTQDAAVQESAGPIVNRTIERLGTSDTAIIVARQVLLKAARELQQGAVPPGLTSDSQRVRAASVILAKGVPFQEGAREELRLKDTDYVTNAPSA
ncbi:Rieske 2Fe-2S domain-containing protein [Alicyclobacillus sp. ALC3]|uniref:Rieske 2Fe-2S domain-containing protein n=1 Tax=Alicyclobacillus sp. ALC3 TaxID=2796143 RepID=UPI0023783040|nr:Rieske 2Fe-2S domain-containing protein [Alicyclobacillus sp. ALC3]WDL97745.1 Rieske 2Fe-2S domain-containing protein [Alicyclobacillus sp. ALC3]